MLRAVLAHLVGFIVDLALGVRRSEDAKDLEIALLRHRFRLLQRHAGRPPRLSRWEQLTLRDQTRASSSSARSGSLRPYRMGRCAAATGSAVCSMTTTGRRPEPPRACGYGFRTLREIRPAQLRTHARPGPSQPRASETGRKVIET